MKASDLGFRAAALLALSGMGWGIAMAMSGDHATAPGHAHLNLLGWVSLFLMAGFYRLYPPLDGGWLAKLQVMVWAVGAALLGVAVGMIHNGQALGEPFAAVASIALFLAMTLFAWLVFQATGRRTIPAAHSAVPPAAE